MSPADILILAVLAVLLGLLAFGSVRRRKKRGGCAGCAGCTRACGREHGKNNPSHPACGEKAGMEGSTYVP